MPVMMQGTIPYPPNAEARPIIELATQLRELGQLFTQQSGQIRQTAATATSTWTGQAAGMFVQNMTGRADAVSDVGRLLGQAATPLQALAAAITTTQATYSAAATAERAAQAGLPWTAGALAAAIAAETGAVTAHQAAGFACAGALGGIVAQIAIKEFFGGRRNGGTTPTNGDRGDGQGVIDTVFDWIFGEDEQPATTPTTGGTAPTDQVPVAPPTTPDTNQPAAPPGTIGGTTFDTKAPAIMRRLMDDFDLTDEQAAAIVGNLGHESGGFQTLQEIRPTVRGSRGGYGWAQWTGPRRRAFEAWTAQQGLAPSSDEANYGFLAEELRGSHRGSLTGLRRADGLEAQVQAFERRYEGAGIKHYDSRQRYAERALEAFRNASGRPTGN